MVRTYLAFLIFLVGPVVRAGDVPEPYRETAARGLGWLAEQQRRDGSWASSTDGYRTALTALAGMALALEGSNVSEGEFSLHLHRSSLWLLNQSQSEGKYAGLIGNPALPLDTARYMFGHGLALEFLAKMYGETNDAALRRRMQDVLIRGVRFAAAAQSSSGGWFYTSKIDSGHERVGGVVTVFVLTGLHEARQAGIAVPGDAIKKGFDYLEKATDSRGGVAYMPVPGGPSVGGGRPVVTTAALYLRASRGDLTHPVVAKHLAFCRQTNSYEPINFAQASELVHYFHAKAIYRLECDRLPAFRPT